MNIILDLLILAGSIALFLFGMKKMSEALQKIAGSRMRYALRTMTNSVFKQVLVGFTATSIIQSSSATTVMIVGLVNAGVITLFQSLGMIMGANIGTTTTAWVISLLGFNLNMSVIAIPLVAFGFTLLVRKSSNTRAFGNAMIGFALLFISLDYMKGAVDALTSYTGLTNLIDTVNGLGFASVLIYLFLGLIITIIIQSSSAAVALTIVMCSQGAIPFELGAAMVLGENVGTAIISNFATSQTNISAKRAARFHFLFNLLAVLVTLILFGRTTHVIEKIIVWGGCCSPMDNTVCTPLALAMFHTMLNLSFTLLLLALLKPMAKILESTIKDSKNNKNKLQYIDSGMFVTGAISIVQAQQAIKKYAQETSSMFTKVKRMFNETNQQRFCELYTTIEQQEHSTDAGEQDFNIFLTNAMKGDIGDQAKEHIRSLSRLVADIDIMSGAIYSIAKIVKRRKDKGAWFTPQLRENVNQMFELIDSALAVMNQNVNALITHKRLDMEVAMRIEELINHKQGEFKDMSDTDKDGDEINILSMIIFNDIISKAEQLADIVLRISKDVSTAVKNTSTDIK